METKPLLYGLIGFFIGGLLVSVAATTFDKPLQNAPNPSTDHMPKLLEDKQGYEFDKALIADMIKHNEIAIETAKLSSDNAKHDETKKLSQDIILSRQVELGRMEQLENELSHKISKDRE